MDYALGILIIAAIVIGTPIAAFVAFFKSRANERQLEEIRQALKRLTQELESIRGGVSGAAPMAREPEKAPAAPQPARHEEPVAAQAAPAAAAPPPARHEEVPAPAALPSQPAPPPLSPPPAAPRPAAPKQPSLEDALTSRWLVWLGAVAIALAGVFFVKYAIEHDLLGPSARVTLGVLFGVALALAGEWLRRSPLEQAIAAIRPNHVPPALTASGLFVAFASLYAGYAVYGLMSPVVAFLLLALIALIAVGLSLLQGAFVALMGLVGGFVTPALITTHNPSAWTLFAYLFVVEAACLAVVRYRTWWWLAFATLAGVAAWPILWIVSENWLSADALPLGVYLLISVAAFFLMRTGMEPPPLKDSLRQELRHLDVPERALWLAGAVIAAVLFIVVAAADYSEVSLLLFGLAIALYLLIGRSDKSVEGIPIPIALATLAVAGNMTLPDFVKPPLSFQMYAPLVPPELSFYAVTCGAYGGLFALGGFAALWGARRSGIWAALSAGVPVALVAIAYSRIVDFAANLQWAGLAIALAALSLFAAERVERHRAARGLDVALGFYAAAVVAFVSLAATMSLREAWLTVALSVQLPALGWIRKRIPVRALDLLAGAIAATVLVRLVLNYNILHYALTGVPLFNWILYGYGVPAAAFFASSRLFRNAAQQDLAMALEGGALAFFVLLVSLEIRVFIDGRLDAEEYNLLEQSLQSIAWLAIGAGLSVLDGRKANRVAYYGSMLLFAISAVQIVFLQLLDSNPLYSNDSVGGVPFIDVMLLAYAVPAAFAFWASRLMERHGQHNLALALEIAGYVLSFVYLSLEVRRAFHGPLLSAGVSTDAEIYTYSAVWIGYAVILLVLGIVLYRSIMRYGALAVLAMTSLKVFLYDMSGLTGLYRVASFLGLGLSLLGIGFLYQRFVLPRPTQTQTPGSG